MNKWPNSIPHDLDAALDELDCWRTTPANSDIWSTVLDWLQKHGVEAPEGLPTRPKA
ncbi:hypothetical protein [Roseobacter sp.]|uniref:hypothetical protein n=1 Tax=Roseobacter sp. TaxID=1907202 RepID=UPI003859531B